MVAASVQPLRAPRKAEGKPLAPFRKCNPREKRFCALIAQGMGARNAYKQISGCKSDGTADVQAWRWNARPAVRAEIARLRAELTEDGALSRAEKRHTLANITRAEDAAHRDKLTAIAIDNRMTGDDEPFRKAAGDDLRVAIFVVRLGEDAAPGLPADPADAARNVTPNASDASAPS